MRFHPGGEPVAFWPDLSYRANVPEWIDLREDDAASRRQFELFSRINRHVGAVKALTAEVLGDLQGPSRILEIGSGAGDVALRILAEAARRGLEIELWCCENHPAALGVFRQRILRAGGTVGARESSLSFGRSKLLLKERDAFVVLRKEKFDRVFGHHFLHHVPQIRLAKTLKTITDRCKDRAVFSDLRRSRAAYVAWLLYSAITLSRTRHPSDGAASIRKSFREEDFSGAPQGKDAILSTGRVAPWRLLVTIRKNPPAKPTTKESGAR